MINEIRGIFRDHNWPEPLFSVWENIISNVQGRNIGALKRVLAGFIILSP
jgi:hypothetical protein